MSSHLLASALSLRAPGPATLLSHKCCSPLLVKARPSEVAKKSVSARPGPILEGMLRSRMGPGRAGMAPTSGPGWVSNAVKQSTWRIWTGPLRTRDGTWMGTGSDPGKGLDGTPSNSGAGNGCADFMGAWHFRVLSAGKPPCP